MKGKFEFAKAILKLLTGVDLPDSKHDEDGNVTISSIKESVISLRDEWYEKLKGKDVKKIEDQHKAEIEKLNTKISSLEASKTTTEEDVLKHFDSEKDGGYSDIKDVISDFNTMSAEIKKLKEKGGETPIEENEAYKKLLSKSTKDAAKNKELTEKVLELESQVKQIPIDQMRAKAIAAINENVAKKYYPMSDDPKKEFYESQIEKKHNVKYFEGDDNNDAGFYQYDSKNEIIKNDNKIHFKNLESVLETEFYKPLNIKSAPATVTPGQSGDPSASPELDMKSTPNNNVTAVYNKVVAMGLNQDGFDQLINRVESQRNPNQTERALVDEAYALGADIEDVRSQLLQKQEKENK